MILKFNDDFYASPESTSQLMLTLLLPSIAEVAKLLGLKEEQQSVLTQALQLHLMGKNLLCTLSVFEAYILSTIINPETECPKAFYRPLLHQCQTELGLYFKNKDKKKGLSDLWKNLFLF